MFRKLALAAAGCFALSTAVMAADLPQRTYAPPPPVIPAFTWTGFYIGLNAGVGWSDGADVAVTDPLRGAVSLSGGGASGFVGGGQIGYNVQFGAAVVGLEADIQYADLGSDYNFAGNGYGFFGLSNGSDSQYLGTVRARLGYAIDRTLIYITGGLAYGGLNSTWWSGGTSNTGWTIGGGVEYAFTNNWTVRLEGLYVNLDAGNRTINFVGPGGNYIVAGGSGDGGGLVRVGVNYKF